MTEQRRLAAIVSADIAGYSRLMGHDESGTLAALKALRQEVVDPAIARHGGRIVKTTGDGLLLEFPSVVNAVCCATEVQTAMADRTYGISEDRRTSSASALTSGTSLSRATTSSATAVPGFVRNRKRREFVIKCLHDVYFLRSRCFLVSARPSTRKPESVPEAQWVRRHP
jgi:hypothetical protein